MRYDIIWGVEYPMSVTNLTHDEAQAMIDSLEARGITFTVVESAHAHA